MSALACGQNAFMSDSLIKLCSLLQVCDFGESKRDIAAPQRVKSLAKQTSSCSTVSSRRCGYNPSPPSGLSCHL